MSVLAQQRCFNHAGREAAVRCPSCRHFYCRECVAEHEHRLLCAKCIQSLLDPEKRERHSLFSPLMNTIKFAAALALLWVLFLVYGQFLLLLPSEFHNPVEARPVMEAQP